MGALPGATDKARRTLHVAVTAAVLGVAAMFTAAFTFAGGEAQASEATQIAVADTGD